MKKSTILTMLLAAFTGCLLLTGCGNKVEKEAVKYLNEQFKDEAKEAKKDGRTIPERKCTAVKITEKVDDTTWEATATLAIELPITVRKDGRDVEVEPFFDEVPKDGKKVSGSGKLEKEALKELKKMLKAEAKKDKNVKNMEVTAVKITAKEDGVYYGTATIVAKGPIEIEKNGDEVKVK